MGVGQCELQSRLVAGPVFGPVEFRPHLEIRRGPDEQHAVLANRQSGCAIAIDAQFDRAGQFRGQVELVLAAPAGHFELVRDQRLAVLEQIEKHRLAAAAQRQDADRLAAVVHGLVGADQEVLGRSATFQRHLLAAGQASLVAGPDRPRGAVVLGLEVERGDAQFSRRQLVLEAADGDSRACRPPVGIAGEQVHGVPDAADQRSGFGDHLDADWLRRHDPPHGLRLRLPGGVLDRHGDADRRVARVLFAADQRGGHRHAEGCGSLRIGPDLGRRQRCGRDVGALKGDLYAGVCHRLAKEIAGLDAAVDACPGLIERQVKFDVQLELGQDVLLHVDRDCRSRVAQLALQLVGPLRDFDRQRAVGRRDAEAAGHIPLAEDHVALGVLGREDGLAPRDRLAVAARQGQTAEADRLARLIHGLVGRQHQLPRAFQLDEMAQRFLTPADVGPHPQFVFLTGLVGQAKHGPAAAEAVGGEAGQANHGV